MRPKSKRGGIWQPPQKWGISSSKNWKKYLWVFTDINKLRGKKEQLFLRREFRLINVEDKSETEIQHQNHSSNCCRQAPSRGAQISRQEFQEKQDICITLQDLPGDILNPTGGENQPLPLQWIPPHPSDYVMHWHGMSLLWDSYFRMHKFNLVMRTYQRKSMFFLQQGLQNYSSRANLDLCLFS